MRDARLLPPTSAVGMYDSHSRFNLDGFIAYSSSSYSLLFRTGATESVTAFPVDSSNPPLRLYGLEVETVTLRIVQNSLRALRSCGIQSPLSVHIELGAMSRVRIVTSRRHELTGRAKETADRDILALPHILLEDDSQELTQFLRPAFDAFWQSSGWEHSPGYEANGVWDESAHSRA